ncbi:MAG TPA: flagellar biosynthetic protein FliO [Gammaproteobacteria bacterium]|nr:flagellar biosynthetic protein FliO [Gammaproteobacteria bacterium]
MFRPTWLRLLSVTALAPATTLAAATDPAAAPAATGTSIQEPLAVNNLLQLTLGMLAVLALIMAIAWLLKRSGRFQMGAGGGLRILGGLSMGARERVVLLQVGETQLLVGVAPGRVQTLHVLDRPLEENEAVTGAGFPAQLASLLNKGKQP